MTVTTSLTIAPGCVYPVYELTLTQAGDDAPIFEPESVIVGPGVPMPHTITVTAVTTGTITFDVQLYGERNCGNGWQWHYLYGESANVTVQSVSSGNLPDLIISDITYNGGTPQCGTHPPDLGARVWVQNVGNAPAGPFVIDVNNGNQQTVDGLAVGEEMSLVFGGVLGSVTAVADATNLVEESDESNNSFSTILPIPTQPPPCTPTPSPQQFLPLVMSSPPVVEGTVLGTVLIEDGICCIGGIAGEMIALDTTFSAVSSAGTVDKMRSNLAVICLDETVIASRPWELFVPAKTFTLTVPLNLVGFNVSVQFGDDAGNVSAVYCDDIVVEGFPSPPSSPSPPLPSP